MTEIKITYDGSSHEFKAVNYFIDQSEHQGQKSAKMRIEGVTARLFEKMELMIGCVVEVEINSEDTGQWMMSGIVPRGATIRIALEK